MEKRSGVVICDNLLDHILYECMMYYGTLRIYLHLLYYPHTRESLSAENGLESICLQDIALESHLLHARNLLEFFKDNGQKNDKDKLSYKSVLKEFKSGFSIITNNTDPISYTAKSTESDTYKRVSTMLLHLSPKRADTEKIGIDEVINIAERICPCVRAFWESVQRQDNFVTDCKWYSVAKHDEKTVDLLESYKAENCPNHEWMSDVSKFELKHAPSFSDITITDRPKESKLAKADESLNRKLSFLGIETDTTTCNAAYKVFSANLDDDKED